MIKGSIGARRACLLGYILFFIFPVLTDPHVAGVSPED